jgi:hypothetical protein
MRIENFISKRALLVFSGIFFAFSISADPFLHNDSVGEDNIECHICSNDVTESNIDIDKIGEAAKEIPKKITAASLLNPQLTKSYSTRAPPNI